MISLIVWDDMFDAEIDLCLNLYIYCTDPRQHGIYLFYMIKMVKSKCSEFYQRNLWPPSLIEMTAEGRGQKKSLLRGRLTVKNKEKGGVGE